MIKLIRIAALAAVVALTGCQTMGGGNQTAGTLLGAAGGGLLGAQFGGGSGKIAMAVLGALAGSQIGAHIGQTMDRQDAMNVNQTLATTPVGHATQWSNKNTGYEHVVEPGPVYRTTSNQQCREFTHTVYIGGKPERAYGTACLQPDGSWKIAQ